MTGIERRVPAASRDAGVEAFARQARAFMPGKDVVLTVAEAKREQSQSQLGALFGIAYKILMQEIGLRGEREKAELHDTFCGMYWGQKTIRIAGEDRTLPIRTTTTNEEGKRDVITTKQQIDFYEFIQHKAAEMGFDIPDPDPMWRTRAENDAADAARYGATKTEDKS